jgi:uncharacterized membrane protein
MRQFMTSGLLWFSAIGCGLMAGVYFAFSTFIMTALGRLDQAAGIAAMHAINVDIVRSLFMPLFLGTTMAGAALVVMGVSRFGEPGAVSMIAAVQPSAPEAGVVWVTYLKDWVLWNHVRTVASVGGCACFIVALTA